MLEPGEHIATVKDEQPSIKKKVGFCVLSGVLGLLPNNSGQQNLTFFLAHEGKYLILIELLTLNSNM